MKTKILLIILAILPFLGGCSDNEDDIKELIAGKTWRLVGFYEKNDNEIHFTDDETIFDNNKDGFYLKFNQDSTFYGKGIKDAFNGKWSNKNGYDLSMNITNESEDEELDIAIEYINAIKGAYSCKGTDENILVIKYKSSQKDRYMLFRIK